MSVKPDNPYAFPSRQDHTDELHITYEDGMTLRDYFAAKAMQSAMISDRTSIEADCRAAYQYADAMLKARKEQP